MPDFNSGVEKHKKTLGSLMLESEKAVKKIPTGILSKGHRIKFEGDPTGHKWDSLNIIMNNDYNVLKQNTLKIHNFVITVQKN